jgi:hypothetical protein
MATKDNKEPLAAMFERRRTAMAADHAVVVRLLPPQSNSLGPGNERARAMYAPSGYSNSN